LPGSVIAGAVGIAFLAAGTQSLTGFGFAFVMVPLLSLIWDVKLAMLVFTGIGVIISASGSLA